MSVSELFRKELVKILPGYKWTVHRTLSTRLISATGVQSSGFNRLSTIEVTRYIERPWYEVAGYGYGTRALVAGRGCGETLSRAIRNLQNHYASERDRYSNLERQISEARTQQNGGGV